jgi:uncharacterized membrane protein
METGAAMTLDAMTLLAIAAMAVAPAAARLSGYFLMRVVQVEGRLKAALDALPPAILMAVIAPTVLATGFAETGAAMITALAAWFRLPLLAVLLIGVASVVALRAVLGTS